MASTKEQLTIEILEKFAIDLSFDNKYSLEQLYEIRSQLEEKKSLLEKNIRKHIGAMFSDTLGGSMAPAEMNDLVDKLVGSTFS